MNRLILLALLSLCINFINGKVSIPDQFNIDCQDPTLIYNLAQAAEELNEEVCVLLGTSEDRTHCCLYTDSSSDSGKCIQITDDQYENIVRFKKFLRDESGDDKIDIDCSSKFLSFSLFVVFALLF